MPPGQDAGERRLRGLYARGEHESEDVMTYYRRSEAERLGFACVDHPAKRIAAAVGLFTRKPIGVKWSSPREERWLSKAVGELPVEDRAKVDLVYIYRQLRGPKHGTKAAS